MSQRPKRTPIIFIAVTIALLFAWILLPKSDDSDETSNTSASKTVAVPKKHKTISTTSTTADLKSLSDKLEDAVSEYVDDRKGVVSVAVFDENTGSSFSSSNETFDTASIIKLTIAEALMDKTERESRSVTNSEEVIAARMIANSDNDSATNLWNEVGSSSGVSSLLSQIGTENTKTKHFGLLGFEYYNRSRSSQNNA